MTANVINDYPYHLLYLHDENKNIIANVIIIDLIKNTYTIEFTKKFNYCGRDFNIGDKLIVCINNEKVAEEK